MEIEIRSDAGELVGNGRDWNAELRLVLDEDGNASVYVKDCHSSDNGTPMDEWHARTLVWSNRSQHCGVVDRRALEKLAESVKPLLERVHAGHDVKRDGSNMVGTLDEDAREASEEIDCVVSDCDWSDDNVSVWEAGDWVSANWRDVASDLKLTANSTQDEKDAAEAALIEMADAENCRLLDVERAIEWLVEQLQDENEDAA